MISLELDIYELGLQNKTMYALNNNGIYTIKQLVALSHEDLMKMPGIGPNTKADIMICLKKHELHLGIR